MEDQKITALKVNDKVVPSEEYDKYKDETEMLKQELKEIEMPSSPGRVRVYRDYSSKPDGSYFYKFDFDDQDDNIGIEPRSRAGRRTFTLP